ncbi:MAG TPA: TetR/AcrR family transcriptional regulator [Bosea sp. (in: a-proteobacteria)]|jgi:AcrR family transcriptional regulator|uniref:TetR/AcrR family transcriptional regulator n=1 Tax=Bosea sp. (in: a-proteobacteria) TaxID=1871050 RepID=UPI002E159482|nr:TetR/AcrR family transcriptional regulator [Bosea sp. (in: a-proteobacteria)]
MVKTTERRERQREALIMAAEGAIAEKGLSGLKARDLANEVGCALGAIYNLVADMDELVLRVGSRTLARLDSALAQATDGSCSTSSGDATNTLVAIAKTYCAFARENLQLWRTLFEHRMAEGAVVPEWAISEQMTMFRYILAPLRALQPQASEPELMLLSRTLFSAVHGIVMLGLEEKLIAVPPAELDGQIEAIVRALGKALKQEA